MRRLRQVAFGSISQRAVAIALAASLVATGASQSVAATPVGDGQYPVLSSDGLSIYFWPQFNLDPTLRKQRTLATLTDVAAPLPVLRGGNSGGIGVTPNGRYIVYTTYASIDTNPYDLNESADVYVLDTVTSAVSRASLGNTGVEGNLDSTNPSISHDGRYVVFQSSATNLVTGDANGFYDDIFVRDRCVSNGSPVVPCMPSTKLVSVGPDGTQSPLGAELRTFGGSSISGDGRYVVFDGHYSGVPRNGSPCQGVILRDRCVSNGTDVPSCTASTVLASRGPGGAYPNSSSSSAVISGDGTKVAFESRATNITADPDPGSYDVFLLAATPIAVSPARPATAAPTRARSSPAS